MLLVIIMCLGISLVFTYSYHDQLDILQTDHQQLQNGLLTLHSVQIGKDYLESINRSVGTIESLTYEEKMPNYYWHEDIEIELELYKSRVCWVIRFETVKPIGCYYEVWVDAETNEIVGGDQSR